MQRPNVPEILYNYESPKLAVPKNTWGGESYAKLITTAIRQSPGKRATLAQSKILHKFFKYHHLFQSTIGSQQITRTSTNVLTLHRPLAGRTQCDTTSPFTRSSPECITTRWARAAGGACASGRCRNCSAGAPP